MAHGVIQHPADEQPPLPLALILRVHGLRALDPAGRGDPLRRLGLRRLPGTLRRGGAFLGVLEVAAHPDATFFFDARPRYRGRGSSSHLWRRCRRRRPRQRRTRPTSLSPDVDLRRSGSGSSTPRRAATTPSRSPMGPSTSWLAVTSRTRLQRSGASSTPVERSSPSRSAAETWRSSTT